MMEIAYIGRVDGYKLDIYPQNAEAWSLLYKGLYRKDDHGVGVIQVLSTDDMFDAFRGFANKLGQRLYVYHV